MIHDQLPRRVRREVRRCPFVRIPQRDREPGWKPPPRVFESHAEVILVRRQMLYDTLACGLTLTEDLVGLAKENSGVAEWVKARVPPDVWARLDNPREPVVEGPEWTVSSDVSERRET